MKSPTSGNCQRSFIASEIAKDAAGPRYEANVAATSDAASRRGAGIKLTWAAAMRQPSTLRTQTWLCLPVTLDPARWNSVLAVANLVRE